MMMNAEHVYADAGRKAARAANNGDQATALHIDQWMRSAARLELPEHRKAAERAYADAYRAARSVLGHRS